MHLMSGKYVFIVFEVFHEAGWFLAPVHQITFIQQQRKQMS